MAHTPKFNEKDQKDIKQIIDHVKDGLVSIFKNASEKGYKLNYYQQHDHPDNSFLMASPKSDREDTVFGFDVASGLIESHSSFASPRVKVSSNYISKQAQTKAAKELGLIKPPEHTFG